MKVTIPDQRAFIYYADGVEHLVIETSFSGPGTNFAWVVPLPAAALIQKVSDQFFPALEYAFRPRVLIHQVPYYFAGVWFVLGLLFLGKRAYQAETSWVVDLPLCLFLAAGVALLGGHAAWGILALILMLLARMLGGAPVVSALLTLTGLLLVTIASLQFLSRAGSRLVNTLGSEAEPETLQAVEGVRVLNVQRAGTFETATIQGTNATSLLQWLLINGYHTPPAAEPAIRYYAGKAWVFAASRVYREENAAHTSSPHPLAFTFKSPQAVYPTRLTAVGNESCAMDLYVFGEKRAAARRFSALRSDKVLQASAPAVPGMPIRISEPDVLRFMGNSRWGTKLSATLSGKQMAAADVEIKSSVFGRTGHTRFSYRGALMIALNVGLTLAALSWACIGAMRGGWGVAEKWVFTRRWQTLVACALIGIGVFVALPKTEVEVQPGAYHIAD